MLETASLLNIVQLGLVLIVALWTLFSLSYTVKRVERKLDLLIRHAGVNMQEMAVREAKTYLAQGKKIEAIKVYRDYTGTGLAEAKRAVEKLQEGA